MYLNVNGARLFWDCVGSSLAVEADGMKPRPALIALHGGPGFDHSSMRPYFDRFADTHQVFFIDHRGNGRSGGEPETWTLDQWGDDLAAFCDELGIEKPVVFGQSFGGMAAMAFATRHPDMVGKLVLSSTAARMRLEDTYEIMGRMGGQEAADIARRFWNDPTPKGAGDYMAKCMPLYNPAGGEAAAAVRARAIMRLEVMFSFIQGEQRRMNLLPALGRVTSPTLVLVGGMDPITPVACAQEIFDALPPGIGRLEIFDKAGHGVHRDEPERAEAALRAFFKEA
jgi:proline iminopeptidase